MLFLGRKTELRGAPRQSHRSDCLDRCTVCAARFVNLLRSASVFGILIEK